MVGGGALFWKVLENNCFKQYVINDTNDFLISAYQALSRAQTFNSLCTHLVSMELQYHSAKDPEKYFSQIKTRQFELAKEGEKFQSLVEKAAIFIFLCKTGFNGLWRVNSSGAYNVSWNKNPKTKIFDEETLTNCHHALVSNDVVIKCGSYANTDPNLELINKSVYYLDPPYIPLKKTASFTSYNVDSFGLTEHTMLAMFCKIITSHGGFVMASNSDVELTRELYADFTITKTSVSRRISCKASSRNATGEVLITNFPLG